MPLGVRMVNCPKCNAAVESPLKSWKIKQTPIGLYECPSCKAKWRSKLIVEAAVATPTKPPETATISRIKVETPSRPVSTPVAAAPSESSGAFEGIRRFFSSIFNL